MRGFAEAKIKSVRTHSTDYSWSPEEYRALIERIEREAHSAEEEYRRQAHARAREIARRQGVEPILSIENMPRDPAPDEDSVDEFLSWIYAIRRQDKDRSALE